MDYQTEVSLSGTETAAPQAEEPVSVKKKTPVPKKGGLRRQENLIGWAYISPMVIGILVFTAIPLVMSLIAMFYAWDGIHGLFESPGVGGSYFKAIFGGIESVRYWRSFANTLIFAIQLPVCMIIGLFLALGMNRNMRGVQTFRVIYYLPGIMSIVAVAIVWQNLFKADGTVNNLLGSLGIPPAKWLSSNAGVAFTVNLLLVWKGVGYSALMFIAGLQSVSTEQIEAAKIDGASGWMILRKITVPALYPTIFYLFVTGLMGSLQMFNEPYILLGGYGIGENGMTVVGFVYYNFGESKLGLASVGAWILAIIIFIITAIQMFVDRKRQEDY